MTNRSFSDLSAGERRERIAAILAVGLLRNLTQRSKISANSGNQSLEVCSDLGLSVSRAGRRREALGRSEETSSRLEKPT